MSQRKWTRGGHRAPCTCAHCRETNRAYDARRRRLIAYGRWEPFTAAAPVREHIKLLAAAGISHRRAAEIAGVPRTTVEHVMYGRPSLGLPPARRIRTETAQAILAVQPAEEHLASGVQVDGTGTRRRLQALVTLGWSERALAEFVGIGHAHLTKVVRGRHEVTAATARKTRAVYDRMWDRPPAETTRGERISAARARGHATRHGWAPPGAWDDEGPHGIDNPDGTPAGVLVKESPVVDERAAWLVATGKRRVPLTAAERLFAARLILATGGGVSLVGKRLHVNGTVAAELVAEAEALGALDVDAEGAAAGQVAA